MSARIPPLDPASTTGPVRETFDATQAKIGMVPNLYRVMGHSPAALGAYLALNQQLAGGVLGAPLREKIALAVSQRNACGYCLSAHTAIARMAGVDPDGIAAARDARAQDPREAAALTLAAKLVDARGWVSDTELAELRKAGLSDADLIEVVAVVAALTFSNYVNHLARTPIDFPLAPNLPSER